MAEEEIVSGESGDIPHAISIAKDAKTEVESRHSSGEVRSRIVKALADKEIEDRVSLLTKALGKRKEMQGALYKIKPDVVTVDGEGKPVQSSFTKPKFEELKKAKEELAKLDTAIEKAMGDKADYEGLKKLVGG